MLSSIVKASGSRVCHGLLELRPAPWTCLVVPVEAGDDRYKHLQMPYEALDFGGVFVDRFQ